MLQIPLKLEMWLGQDGFLSRIPPIEFRGYRREFVTLGADLYETRIDAQGRFKGLSVEAIGSMYCPTRRDLYFDNPLKGRRLRSRSTWGRSAGHLVHDFLEGFWRESGNAPVIGSDLTSLGAYSREYLRRFSLRNKRGLNKLRTLAVSEFEDPSHLSMLLGATAEFELWNRPSQAVSIPAPRTFFDRLLRKPTTALRGGSAFTIAMGEEAHISPPEYMGLSALNTPDFLLHGPHTAIGEVKTGERLQPFHLATVAGYALAYESQHRQPVDLGVIVFLATHVRQLDFAQAHFFAIDDFLRRTFLYSRDDAYKILAATSEPDLPHERFYDTTCRYCKFHNVCYPDRPLDY